jgi:ABC-type enterochelin transport system permease subunit
MAFNPNKIFTSISTHILNLVEAIMGAFNAIFMRRVWYLDNIHLIKSMNSNLTFDLENNIIQIDFEISIVVPI